jgi:hypothetical protein
MPRLATLTAAQIDICDNTLRERGMIAPNKAILAAIVMTSPTLVRCLKAYYPGDVSDGTLDTYERDYLMDAVANNYCQADWPCFGDDIVVAARFMDTLVENASKTGWVFATA